MEKNRQKARKIASALVKLGLKKGDRLGTISPNNKEHLELIYAISGLEVLHTQLIRDYFLMKLFTL